MRIICSILSLVFILLISGCRLYGSTDEDPFESKILRFKPLNSDEDNLATSAENRLQVERLRIFQVTEIDTAEQSYLVLQDSTVELYLDGVETFYLHYKDNESLPFLVELSEFSDEGCKGEGYNDFNLIQDGNLLCVHCNDIILNIDLESF